MEALISLVSFLVRLGGIWERGIELGYRHTAGLSDPFSIRKRQLLGGRTERRPPQDIWWPKGPLVYLRVTYGRSKFVN